MTAEYDHTEHRRRQRDCRQGSHLPDRRREGRCVLLIDGLCGTPAQMRFVAMGLGRAGYTVHCPQLAGHGGTRQDIC